MFEQYIFEHLIKLYKQLLHLKLRDRIMGQKTEATQALHSSQKAYELVKITKYFII